MKLLKQYFKLQQEIYDYFGYEEVYAYKAVPFVDRTNEYWMLLDDKKSFDKCKYAYSESKFSKESIENGQDICGGIVYLYERPPKNIYKTKDYTMICCPDTRRDGNRFLMIFDNALEEKDEELKKLYDELW